MGDDGVSFKPHVFFFVKEASLCKENKEKKNPKCNCFVFFILLLLRDAPFTLEVNVHENKFEI